MPRKRLRVGRMPYLNSEVFYRRMPADDVDLVAFPPREMARTVERGELDAGPIPVAECFRMEDALTPLDDFCIATKKESVSILLYSNRLPDELEGARIAVTEETATSVQLLRVLFAERWLVEPEAYVTRDEEHDAILLIGDEALRRRHGIRGLPFVHDLGAEWHDHTGLPFVYARWVARKEADSAAVAEFERTLERSLQQGLAAVDEISEDSGEGRDLTPEEVRSYLDQFTYKMGEREHEALTLFREMYEDLSPWRPMLSEEAVEALKD